MQEIFEPRVDKENMVWGVGAFVAVAVAVVSINAGPLLPQEFRSAMHSSRFGATDSIALGAQMVALNKELRLLGQENVQLQQRVAAINRQSGSVSQRVASLESIMPEGFGFSADGELIDGTLTTASTGTEQPSNNSQLRVRMVPMSPTEQTMPSQSRNDEVQTIPPEDLIADVPLTQSQFALDFGRTASSKSGLVLWDELQTDAGTLLFGLEPLLRADADGEHLVVGPIANISQVLEVCQAFAQIGYICAPVTFEGEKLAP